MNSWVLNEGEEFVFKHPFRCFIAGPSCCGKTHLLNDIILNQNKLIDKKIDRIVWCYNSWQPSYETLKYLNLLFKDLSFEFYEGLIGIDTFDSSKNNLLVIDDLMHLSKDNDEIYKLFTIHSHHRNISVFLVSQNIFSKGKFTREISLNCSNKILFRNPRDGTQISILARQLFPGKVKAFMEIVKDFEGNNKHGYLFLDFNQTTDERLRIQTNIIPTEENPRIIYTFR